jgi:hypothetical protein
VSRDQKVEGGTVFEYPPFLGYLMAACGLLLLFAVFIPGIEGNESKIQFFLTVSPFWFGAIAFSVYVLRYRVTVSEDGVAIRAYRQTQITNAEIVDTDLLNGRSPELVVYLRNGHRIRLSGMLQEFNLLASMITGKLTRDGQVRPDSPQKLADQARIRKGNRDGLWIMLVGVALVIGLLVAIRFFGLWSG